MSIKFWPVTAVKEGDKYTLFLLGQITVYST